MGMAAEGPLADRVPSVADAWFSYVENNPFAWKMLFQDVTGDPEIRASHAGMRDAARSAIVGLLRAEPTLTLEPGMLEPVAELLRSAMTGLALWWLEHPDVLRATLVDTVLQTIWAGLVETHHLQGGVVWPEGLADGVADLHQVAFLLALGGELAAFKIAGQRLKPALGFQAALGGGGDAFELGQMRREVRVEPVNPGGPNPHHQDERRAAAR